MRRTSADGCRWIDARKALSESLTEFVPSILQSSSQIAARLELFRTETLAGFEPVEKKETAGTGIDDLLDSTMGLDNFVIPELPIANSRAGLYIYLNAAVSLSTPSYLVRALTRPSSSVGHCSTTLHSSTTFTIDTRATCKQPLSTSS